MKVLLLSDNYSPEMNANARIFSELAAHWGHAGHDVSVITCHPNFPRGKVFAGYQNKWFDRRREQQVDVIRVKTYMHPNRGVLRRSLDFLSFGVTSWFAGLWQKKPDWVMGVSPQLFCAVSACLLAMIKRRPFMLFLCDLWPDSIVATGYMKKGFAYRVLKKIELFLYRRANLIITFSPFFNRYLMALGVDADKIILSLSGADHSFFPREKNPQLLEKYSLKHKFTVAYIGTLGAAHNHDHLLTVAAQLMQQGHSAIHFLLIGDGVNRDALQQQCQQQGLHNVTIDGPFPSDDIPNYWALADVTVTLLADNETNRTVVPSKMLESMAMGKPILLYAPPGEAKELLQQANAGIFIPAGDQSQLLAQLIALANDSSQLATLAANALSFAQQQTRGKQATHLLTQLERYSSTS